MPSKSRICRMDRFPCPLRSMLCLCRSQARGGPKSRSQRELRRPGKIGGCRVGDQLPRYAERAVGRPPGTTEPLLANYPASYRLPNVISVAASDQYNRLTASPISVRTSTWPLGDRIGQRSATQTNTELARHFVRGASRCRARRLLFDLEPTLTASEARRRILARVRPLSTSARSIRGRLNMARRWPRRTVPAPDDCQVPGQSATTFPIPFETALAMGANLSTELR